MQEPSFFCFSIFKPVLIYSDYLCSKVDSKYCTNMIQRKIYPCPFSFENAEVLLHACETTCRAVHGGCETRHHFRSRYILNKPMPSLPWVLGFMCQPVNLCSHGNRNWKGAHMHKLWQNIARHCKRPYYPEAFSTLISGNHRGISLNQRLQRWAPRNAHISHIELSRGMAITPRSCEAVQSLQSRLWLPRPWCTNLKFSRHSRSTLSLKAVGSGITPTPGIQKHIVSAEKALGSAIKGSEASLTADLQ